MTFCVESHRRGVNICSHQNWLQPSENSFKIFIAKIMGTNTADIIHNPKDIIIIIQQSQDIYRGTLIMWSCHYIYIYVLQ